MKTLRMSGWAGSRCSMRNIRWIDPRIQAASASLANVVKTTVFMQDLGQFAAMNAVYAEFFTGNFPARSTVQVAGLPKGALVEIECVAVVG